MVEHGTVNPVTPVRFWLRRKHIHVRGSIVYRLVHKALTLVGPVRLWVEPFLYKNKINQNTNYIAHHNVRDAIAQW